MRSSVVAMILSSAFAVAGCAESEMASSVPVGPYGAESSGGSVSAPSVNPASASLALVSDAIACMVGEAPEPARCAQIAGAAGVPVAALTRAEAGAAEQLTELVARDARREGVPQLVRTPLVRWLDLAAGAAREAHAARDGAAGARLDAATRAADGHPELEAIEDARRTDASHLRRSAQLAALFASVSDADALAPEVEATALVLLAQRIDVAMHAGAEMREDAITALSDLLRGLRDRGALGGRTVNAAQARASAAPDSALLDARTQISERLATLAPRVTARTARALAEATAERTQLARR